MRFVQLCQIGARTTPGVVPNIKCFQGHFGERGGTRTLDPMIKSHVLYHLSYALTRRAV
jgi:hypothetical protein